MSFSLLVNFENMKSLATITQALSISQVSEAIQNVGFAGNDFTATMSCIHIAAKTTRGVIFVIDGTAVGIPSIT